MQTYHTGHNNKAGLIFFLFSGNLFIGPTLRIYRWLSPSWGRVNAAVGDAPRVWALCPFNVLVSSRPLGDEGLKNEKTYSVSSVNDTQPMTDSSGDMITCCSRRSKSGLFLKGEVIRWQMAWLCSKTPGVCTIILLWRLAVGSMHHLLRRKMLQAPVDRLGYQGQHTFAVHPEPWEMPLHIPGPTQSWQLYRLLSKWVWAAPNVVCVVSKCQKITCQPVPLF